MHQKVWTVFGSQSVGINALLFHHMFLDLIETGQRPYIFLKTGKTALD